jgi:hypothetical protein
VLSLNSCCHWKAISIIYSQSVCSLSYPACNAHAPYCYLWFDWLYHIFPHSCQILMKRIFSTNFLKMLKYQISWKSVHRIRFFSHAEGRIDRQTNMTKVIVAFRNFANAPDKTAKMRYSNAPSESLYRLSYPGPHVCSLHSATYYLKRWCIFFDFVT